MNMRLVSVIVGLLMLMGCATAPGIPETTYFRLPPRADVKPLDAPLFDVPVSVDTFIADGLYSDQALIYSLDPDGALLRAYHYQLWVDPPVRMLQRRLLGALRDLNASVVVADRLPSSAKRVRISGRIERFERVRRASGWVSVVSLMLRVEGADDGLPLLLREYREEVPAAGSSMRDSVQAMGQACDRVFADFLRDMTIAARG